MKRKPKALHQIATEKGSRHSRYEHILQKNKGKKIAD
jgi:hypothetical protein